MARTTEEIQAKLASLKEQERKLLVEVKKANDKVVFAVGKFIIDNPTMLTQPGLAEVAKLYPAIKKAPEAKPTATSTPTPASQPNIGGGN